MSAHRLIDGLLYDCVNSGNHLEGLHFPEKENTFSPLIMM